MESRPLRWERVRMSAAALLTVQMAITAVVPGADAPIPPPSARPPDPYGPYGSDRGVPDRFTGAPMRDAAFMGAPTRHVAFMGASARNAAFVGGPARDTAPADGPAKALTGEPAKDAASDGPANVAAPSDDRARDALLAGGPMRQPEKTGQPGGLAAQSAFTGGPAGELGGGRTIAVPALASRAPAGRLPAGAFRLVSAADRQDAGSGTYGRSGGLVKLLGMTREARTLDRPQRPLFHAHTQLSHRFAANRLRNADIKRRSTGRCASKHRPNCTSYTAIRAGTVAQLIRLKRRSKCPIVVTGGTETGHAHGRHSHGSGHKVDIATNGCIDAYIRRTHRRVGTRPDGAALYRSGNTARSDIFARERDHWDITFR